MRPTHRHRDRYGIHPWAPNNQVAAETGRHDKVEIRISGTIRYAHPMHHTAYMKAFSEKGALPKIFNAAQGPRGRPSLHRVAKNDWLFAGKLRYRSGDTHHCERSFIIDLSINPTRFAGYAARFDPKTVADLRAIQPELLLARDPETRKRLKAESLGAWDNHISNSPWMSQATREWLTLCQLYVETINNLILDNLKQIGVAALPECPPTVRLDAPSFICPTMKHAEVYWEFSSSDTVKLYAEIAEGLRLAAPNYNQTQRYDVASGNQLRATWLSIELRRGVKLTAYLKTQNRIRMEVSYAPGKGERGSIWELVNFNEGSEGADLRSRLQRLQEDAAARLNAVLKGLHDIPVANTMPVYRDIAETLAAISVATKGSHGMTAHILGQLTEKGVLSTGPATIPIRRAAEALCKAGILRRLTVAPRSAVARFVPTGTSANVFATLRGSTM